MRYINNGIEIQYRECQIARDAAKDLNLMRDSLQLKDMREAWIDSIKALSIHQEFKQADCNTLVNFITNMPLDQYEALTEYVEILVKKGKGIDILVPYISPNGVLIVTVNRHVVWEPEEY